MPHRITTLESMYMMCACRYACATIHIAIHISDVLLQAALMAAKSDKTAMAKAAKKADTILRDLVAITLNTNLTSIQRTNLETCITVHMHQKEISGRLKTST